MVIVATACHLISHSVVVIGQSSRVIDPTQGFRVLAVALALVRGREGKQAMYFPMKP